MELLHNKRTRSLLIILIALGILAILNIRHIGQERAALACRNLHDTVLESDFSPARASQARAFYIYDFTAGTRLYEKNSAEALPLASLTKLMTVRVALAGRNEHSFYTLTEKDLAPEGAIGLQKGETFTLGDFARAALIPSSNDAAFALSSSTGLSEEAFVAAMDTEARRLGLLSMHYENVTGLDLPAGPASNVGSARDTLMLLRQDVSDFPDLFAATQSPKESIISTAGQAVSFKNTNQFQDKLSLLVASKTGYTLQAGGNLAVLWQGPGGHLLGAVVLGSSEEGRFSDMIAIHDAAGRFIQDSTTILSSCPF